MRRHDPPSWVRQPYGHYEETGEFTLRQQGVSFLGRLVPRMVPFGPQYGPIRPWDEQSTPGYSKTTVDSQGGGVMSPGSGNFIVEGLFLLTFLFGLFLPMLRHH